MTERISFTLSLPSWLEEILPAADGIFPDMQDRMRFCLDLARSNVDHGGGPFAAAVFDLSTNRLVAPGVNLVLSTNCSVFHAEIVALSFAQIRLHTYDLGGPGMPVHELVTTTEPCAMCLGAIPWSGVRSVVCGARDADARAIGFDEGPKPADWTQALESRGIQVRTDVCRAEAMEVLRSYQTRGGIIYNARAGRERPDATVPQSEDKCRND